MPTKNRNLIARPKHSARMSLFQLSLPTLFIHRMDNKKAPRAGLFMLFQSGDQKNKSLIKPLRYERTCGS